MGTHNFSCLPFFLLGYRRLPIYSRSSLDRWLNMHWRSRGIRSVVYLDDGLDVEPNEALSSTNLNIIKSDLASAGFLVNMNKCVWDPVQVIT